jgi:acyl-CoA thioester hydrolase
LIIGTNHTFLTTVDFDLLDAGNVVYHPNYLILCERARNSALKDAGYAFSELWNDGFALALNETTSKYLRPAVFGDNLVIVTRTIEGSGVRLEVEQTIRRCSDLNVVKAGFCEESQASFGEELFWLRVKLACVKLNPVRPARPPKRLVDCLKLNGRS